MKNIFTSVCWVLLVFASTTGFGADTTLTFSSDGDGTGIGDQICLSILKEAYQRLGIAIVHEPLPPFRSLEMVNAGEIDGELSRVAGIEQQFPNLVMAPVPIIMLDNVVFTKQAEFAVTGWESLRPYPMALLTGLKLIEKHTQGMMRTFVSQPAQLFYMLNKDRVDIVVYSRLDGLELLRQLQLPDIRILEPPVSQVPLYHYLHKKHQPLVERLTQALQALETEGRLRSIREETVKKLLP